MLLCEIAAELGITERAAQGIFTDLETGGYLTRTRTRIGRRNHYILNPHAPPATASPKDSSPCSPAERGEGTEAV
ncbi:hypothetical protein NE236_30165 [Actinoallomurus purpureus]|uniref:hypothetical protein n=1 Tax=Actinoallomurus purpureus TaxID=478114 RepID=UPI0020936953|nr:hypothetical protein [Actinoallomurus purpureus]MCO6009244.1 hypothetical protein [Actinoallomurus purpureus]